jgi:hypothetical protein
MGLAGELPLVDLPTAISAAKQDPHRVVGGLAAASWVLGALIGSPGLKHVSLGAGAATLLYWHLMKPPAVLTVPTVVQGWG